MNPTRKGLLTRRTFLGASAASGAALLGGGFSLLNPALSSAASSDSVWIEKSIAELQALMASGQLTSRDLTQGYLQRIKELNGLLHAVIETTRRQSPSPPASTTIARRACCGVRCTGFPSS